jgi:hypothetical protein
MTIQFKNFEPTEIHRSTENRAVVASKWGYGAVLWTNPDSQIEFEVGDREVHDLSDLGLDHAPDGIHIWEGKFVWHSNNKGEYETLEGNFRLPTESEWADIKQNKNPFLKKEES